MTQKNINHEKVKICKAVAGVSVVAQEDYEARWTLYVHENCFMKERKGNLRLTSKFLCHVGLNSFGKKIQLIWYQIITSLQSSSELITAIGLNQGFSILAWDLMPTS